MTAIRTPGKINDNTTLIDTGGPDESSRVFRTLSDLHAFPPDYIVLTHAHWDHSQGLPGLRRRSHSIEVLAGKESIPLLEDQSWNSRWDKKKRYENLRDVRPMEDGDVIDLDGLTLMVFDAPGHMKGHIALLDEENRNLFVGDSIGYKFGDEAFIPPFVPPFWDQKAYFATLERLRSIEFDSLTLDHFGYIHGDEARQLLDEAERSCKRLWAIFERVDLEGRLDDT